jgi:membrane associated rhomboid family serine protease
MKISFNAPITLFFAIIAALELLLNLLTQGKVGAYFVAPGSFNDFTLTVLSGSVLHIFGHASFEHFVGNITFILLLGPILEEKYGSRSLFVMILVTAVATATVNALLFSHGIIGASGIVFMMIILSSYVNVRSGAIPATFILIMILFVGKEFALSFTASNISHFAHIFGGCLGGIFGTIFSQPKK